MSIANIIIFAVLIATALFLGWALPPPQEPKDEK